ncbi:MAG: ABC transporter substrate-binding protein [Cetobacterium sp.]
MRKTMRTIFLTVSTLLLFACQENETAKNNITSKKDTLVYAQSADPKTLDPQDSTEQYSQTITTNLYDRLVEINELTGEVVPGLGDSWKMLDENTILIHLNPKTTFSNGEPLTSEDVQFSLERAKTLPKVAHLYKLIEKIEPVDKSTVKITTSEPFAPLLNHLSHKSAAILNKKAYLENPEKYFENPIGTGPYKLKEWKIGDRIVLEAVPTYFKGEPKIKNIVVRGIPEENSRVIGLETGELDVFSGVESIARKTIESSDKLQLLEKPSTSTAYIGMNNQKGVLKDPEVRKAIAMGIDKDAIIEALLMGSAQRADQFLAPPVFGHSDNLPIIEYDPEGAKKIIEEKGLTGTNIVIATSNSTLRQQMCEIVQAQLKEIGINLSIESLEWGAFLNSTGNGLTDMFIMGWGPSTYDGDYGFYPNFHSSQIGGAGNRTYYNSPQMDQLLDAAKKEMNQEKRKKLYEEVGTLLTVDVPVIPLYYSNTSIGSHKNIENLEATSYPLFYKYEFK